jgi:hypothetical protein
MMQRAPYRKPSSGPALIIIAIITVLYFLYLAIFPSRTCGPSQLVPREQAWQYEQQGYDVVETLDSQVMKVFKCEPK